MLPPELASRFTVERALGEGGQGLALLCRRVDGGERVVVKLFNRPHRDGAPDPREDWPELSGEHVARFVEPRFGRNPTWWRRWWEVLEYLPIGSLESYLSARGGRLRHDEVRQVIEQVAAALEYLHSRPPRHIVHRDVKPANILVRSRDPLDVVLTDFGIAVAAAETREFHTAVASVPYAAPEVIATGVTQTAGDWWSLGMMVVELAAGRHPYRDVSGRMMPAGQMVQAIRDAPVPLDGVQDERLRLLARGLLTFDAADRWGAAEVRAWFSGASPRVRDDRRRASVAADRAFRAAAFPQVFVAPEALAEALGRDWAAAGAFVSGRDLAELGAWLPQRLPGVRIDDLVDARALPGSPFRRVDRTITELRIRLDPACEPVFRGRAIHAEGLARLAAAAARRTESDEGALVEALHDSRALRSFEGHETCSVLAAIDARWQRHVDAAQSWFAAVPESGSMSPQVRARLLQLALDQAERRS